MATLAQRLGDFAATLDVEQVPANVVEKAKSCLLNSYGMALGGRRLPYAEVASAAALATHGEQAGGATIFLNGRITSIGGACLANAALFHARAQDDTTGAAHFGTVVVPLLTAMIEARNYPMRRFLPAMIAGYETGGALEQIFGSKTTAQGSRSTAIYGAIAAAASAARMMDLDAETTTAALSIAAAIAGGNLHSATAGSDEWHYQPGLAACNGLTAAELARAGAIASPGGIEGDKGLFPSLARDVPDEAPALRLGAEWQIVRATFKPFPVCAFNQTPVSAALRFRDEIDAATIASLRVRMNPNEANYPGLSGQEPFTSIAATLLSLPFCVAATLLYGIPDIVRLTTFDDPALNALARKIGTEPDPAVPPLSVVFVFLFTDGTTVERHVTMTPRDYAYERSAVLALVKRIGGEEHVPAAAYDRLESFVDRMPNVMINELRTVFAARSGHPNPEITK